jgi:general secretion pathway protein G
MKKQYPRRADCGLRIADCGFESTVSFNPQSEIRNPKLSAGFTLIEVMVVVVILGVLATMVMPKILDKPEQARRTKAKVDIRSIQSALAMFKTDTGRFPTTAEGLPTLVAGAGIHGYNQNGYLERVPTDPWGNKFIYLSPGVHNKDYDLVSYGKDGEQGGTGDDADIESWNLEGAQ